VGVVGRTDEGEGRVVAVLVAVDFFPVARGIEFEGVVDADDGFQEGIGLRGEEGGGRAAEPETLEKLSPRDRGPWNPPLLISKLTDAS
jgi:hypothetical protein